MITKSSPQPTLSVIITAHKEGLLIHKTIRSIERALRKLNDAGYSHEILVSLDQGDEATRDYLSSTPYRMYEWNFGGAGQARNATIAHAKGRYIAIADGDDLVSQNWYLDSVRELERRPYGSTVAHSAMTIEFDKAHSVVQKYASTNRDQDILLSVWAGRWNAVIVAPSVLFKNITYPPITPGYGFEDWHLNCSLLDKGISNIIIPRTVIFVRRKHANSMWALQRTSMSVLPAHTIFTPSQFRNIKLNNIHYTRNNTSSSIRLRAKAMLARSPFARQIAKKTYRSAQRIKHRLHRPIQKYEDMPLWLRKEWIAAHSIEKKIFPPSGSLDTYHTISDDHYKVGLAYWDVCRLLSKDRYDYIIFVPWLTRGGADLYTLSYANSFAHRGKSVLVVGTSEDMDVVSDWHERLEAGVDFIEFGRLTFGLTTDQKHRLLEQLIENTQASILHIINSSLGYEFVKSHSIYIQSTHKKIIVTSFSESIDSTGRVYGYSHTHTPEIYDQATIITTDNEPLRSMWIREYGFATDRVVVHHQPLAETIRPVPPHTTPTRKILWASRIAPEKLPHLVHAISNLLPDDISIDMYGSTSTDVPLKSLSWNDRVAYKGKFDGTSSLPIENYDIFLYTSLFDGMPNTPLEMALAGIPIVASNVGGLRSVMAQNAVLIDDTTSVEAYAKAIEDIYADYSAALRRAKALQTTLSSTFSRSTFEGEIDNLIGLLDSKS